MLFKKNSALEQRIREIFEKSATYIRQTDERIGKMEGEREKDLAGYEGLRSENGKLSAKLQEAEQKRTETEVQARRAIADKRLLEKQLKDRDASITLLEKMQGGQEALQQLRTDTEQNKSENERLTLSLKKAVEANARLQQEKEAIEKQLSAHVETNKVEGELTAKLQEVEQKRAEADRKLAEAEKKVVELSKKQPETQQKKVVIAAQSKKPNQKNPKSESLNRKKLNKKISRKRDSGQG